MADDLETTANAIGEALLKRDENFGKTNGRALIDAYNEVCRHCGSGGFYFFLRNKNKYGPESEFFLRCVEEDRLVLTALKRHLPFVIQDSDQIVGSAGAIISHMMTLDGQMTAVEMYRRQAERYETLPGLVDILDLFSARHQESLVEWRQFFGERTFNLGDGTPAPALVAVPAPPN